MHEPASERASPAADITRLIWSTRYRLAGEHAVDDTWRRVAAALAAAEPHDAPRWRERFHEALASGRFLPGGRILAGAGSGQHLTLFNCFAMGRIDDTLDGIFEALKEGALTMQAGGGVGYDFSTLRPAGAAARRSGAIASGPVSFLHVWDSMCATVLSTANRRGAMMGTLRCDHPDIEAFVDAKRTAGALRHFNLSVLVTDEFMRAVRAGAAWPLLFPAHDRADGEAIERLWPGRDAPCRCQVYRRVPARTLWERIIRAAYDCAEPGVLFIDRIQDLDNLAYCERVNVTNPCGEVPLPYYGACDLGSLNLTRFVRDPFTARATLDHDALAATATTATRMLDNVYDVSLFPLPQHAQAAQQSRRIGLGLTGLADALIMLGLRYGSPQSLDAAGAGMRTICHAAYRASIAIAQEKGSFPCFDAPRYTAGAFVRSLPPDILDGIRRHGIRNSHLVAVAPAGSVSLLAGNVSSGLEPVYAFELQRRIRVPGGGEQVVALKDYAHGLFRERFGATAPLPPAFVAAASVTPAQQIAMQAALAPCVDNAIAKTVNVAEACSFAAFRDIYDDAYRRGLKGCAAFRPNPVTGALLVSGAAPAGRDCAARLHVA